MALDMEKLKRLEQADTVANEVRYCLNRLEQRLQSRGLGKRDIAKISAYMTDESYREELFSGIKDFFAPGPYPVVFAVVAGIAAGCRIEFEAIAPTATTIEFLNPAGAHQPNTGGHSSGAAAHGYVFAAVNALDIKGMKREHGAVTVADETRVCLDGLKVVLAETGAVASTSRQGDCVSVAGQLPQRILGRVQASARAGPVSGALHVRRGRCRRLPGAARCGCLRARRSRPRPPSMWQHMVVPAIAWRRTSSTGRGPRLTQSRMRFHS